MINYAQMAYRYILNKYKHLNIINDAEMSYILNTANKHTHYLK